MEEAIKNREMLFDDVLQLQNIECKTGGFRVVLVVIRMGQKFTAVVEYIGVYLRTLCAILGEVVNVLDNN